MLNTSQNPSISVILPVFNGGSYLMTSVESVLSQSHRNFELLILDDCSTDNSRQYINSLDDPRISFYENPENKGLFYNLNFLIKKSKSNLIKLWTQDDIMYPHCLKEFISFHINHPEIGFSYSGRDIIDENGKINPLEKIDTTPAIISMDLHTRIAFFTGSIAGNISNVTLNKLALEKTGLFNESMKISGDFEMWVRIAQHFPIGFINSPLIQLRDHSAQLSRQEKYYINHLKEDSQVYQYLMSYTNDKGKKEGKKILRNHKLLFYYTLMIKSFMKGSVKNGYSFLKVLSRHDNIFLLSFLFLKNRVFFKKKYAAMYLDNSKFIIPGNKTSA